jgi:UDP-N-acetyl-D-glucosamine dehydrogenase
MVSEPRIQPPAKVVVVGQGYVGLPLAMRAVEVGFDVVGYDVDEARMKRLAGGESYVEDVTNEDLARAIATGRFKATTQSDDLSGFDVAIISVPTPLSEGNPDLSYIESAGATVGKHLTAGATVVLESTTYPGTTEELLAPILEEASGLVAGQDGGFFLGYSPERIDPGNQEWTLVTTPKVVSGIDPGSLAAVQGFFDQIVDRTVPVSTPKEAELTKLLENTFRHVNVALVNELAMFAHDLGIDVWEAIDAASTKPFGFMKFTPGPGVGGHCLPIDPSYLSWQVRRRLGRSFRFVELANDVNDHMPDYVVQRIQAALNREGKALKGSRILLLGLAYKANTGDARESPAVVVADRLLRFGAELRAADPHVVEEEGRIDPRIKRVKPSVEELKAADAVVLLVDHDDVTNQIELIAKHATFVLDCRNVMHSGNRERL